MLRKELISSMSSSSPNPLLPPTLWFCGYKEDLAVPAFLVPGLRTAQNLSKKMVHSSPTLTPGMQRLNSFSHRTRTAKANMIWIDSPVGTGFSYVSNDDYATDEKTIAIDLYNGLQQFLFKNFANYSKNDFYIFGINTTLNHPSHSFLGESYAGKYVPWLASTILEKNVRAPSKINLKGIGIGDGWYAPTICLPC